MQWLIYTVLFVAGMSRSMNFTTITTLAFADISAEQRSGASALTTMLPATGDEPGRRFHHFALNVSQTLRGAPILKSPTSATPGWQQSGALMAFAVAGSLRLAHDAGAAISNRR